MTWVDALVQTLAGFAFFFGSIFLPPLLAVSYIKWREHREQKRNSEKGT